MEDVEIPQYVHRWYMPLWRPDMSRKSRRNVIHILESGLLFKEDSVLVEEALCLRTGSHNSLFLYRILPTPCTRAEKIASTVSALVCVVTVPFTIPIASRGNLVRLCCYAGAACAPLILRLWPAASLPTLLADISRYTMLARRHITSKMWFPIESLSSILVSQQRYLCKVMRTANMSLLEAFPWLEGPRGGIHWEDSHEVKEVLGSEDLTRIHHLLLILQSVFLKNLAVAHFPPTTYTSQYSRSNNDRVFWVHTRLLPAVNYYYEYCTVMLENANKYYKDATRKRDNKLSLPRLISSTRDPWQYSEVHGSVSAIGTDLRLALAKCNEMDTFLEACWAAKSKFSPEVLQEDLTKVRESLLKCFASIETSFVQLKKIRSAEMKILEAAVQKLPLPSVEEEDCDSTSANVTVVSEQTSVQIQDQVFYFENTEESENLNDANNKIDYLTAPSYDEINTTKIVLNELKVKLVKKEDEMREREAKALENTMPELKGKVPDFPRQITLDKKSNIQEQMDTIRISKYYNGNDDKTKEMAMTSGIHGSGDTVSKILSSNVSLNNTLNSLTQDQYFMSHKQSDTEKAIVNIDESKLNSDIDTSHRHSSSDAKIEKDLKNIPPKSQNNNTDNSEMRKLSEKKLDLVTDEYYGSSTDTDLEQESSSSLLKDIRKNRVTRKKNHPSSRSDSFKSKNKYEVDERPNITDSLTEKSDHVADEGSKPIKYSFGAGLAMASLLQTPSNKIVNGNSALGNEETFDGEGEVSDDSGNEDL